MNNNHSPEEEERRVSHALTGHETEEIKPLGTKGATSCSYRVRIGGKEHFMKQLRPELKDDWRYRSAYQKEYEVGRKINNPYIVRYESIDENANGLYILMEHVNGHTLDEKLAMDPKYFSRGNNFEKLFTQILKGLKALHEANVAYMDLKPDNVMLTQVNGDVKIIDLGFCFADAYSHTVGCSYEYAAPELQEGALERVDARTDIYAVGRLMLYVKEAACVNVSKRLQRIIDRCIQPDMQNRYANVNEVLMDLTHRRKWMMRLTIASVLILSLALGFFTFSKTSAYKFAKLELKWWLRQPAYDISYDEVYYRILSEDSLTCIAVGGRELKDLYIHKEVPHNGKTYKTVAIESEAFAGWKIESVYIPNGVREIGDMAFNRCHEVLSLDIPQSVERIGIKCFDDMKSIRNLSLSGNLKKISHNAFTSLHSLKRLNVPEGVEIFDLDCFAHCSSLEKVTLPSTLTTINRGVFWNCGNLKEIIIPASVHTIGEYVFYHCNSLTDVYNYSPIPQSVPPIFNKQGITLHVPKGSEKAYSNTDNWNVANVVGDI
ncbi:MAG: leucine-rich repeat protein [Bacteroidaceae bacterium]|nr:leucine-rich repeat protein [Bacteroidaceae bacterium]MBQ5912495.1 leucine-rich repeat protein [Bacteroidaceae bacterium]